MICRDLSLVFAFLLSIGCSYAFGEEAQDYSPPKLLHRLEVPISEDLRHLHLENPMVVYRVVVHADSTILDYLATEATHFDLLESAEKKLSAAEFEPAKMDGKPVTGKIAIAVIFFDPVQRAWQMGGISMPMGSSSIEGIDRRINMVAAEKNRYVESLQNELDEPLRMLKSELCMVHPPGEPMETGKVTVEYYVNRKGEVRLPRIIKSDGQYLSLSALETLKRTLFAPPSRNGMPTYVKVRQPFNFD